MGTWNAKKVVNKTVALNGQDVVTLTTKEFTHVEVMNLGTGRLYFTVGKDAPAPTVAGEDCFAVGPGMSRVVPDDGQFSETVVKITSAVASDYSISGIISRGQ